MTTYALNTLHLPAAESFGVIIVDGLAWVTFDLVSGLLSDRFGRKPVMVAGTALLLMSILPAFWLIGHHRSMVVFYSASAWMVMLAALGQTPIVVALTESLPRHVRSGVIATVYAFAISIFGGSTQVIITWLIVRTGNTLAPAYYWSMVTAIGLIAMLGLRESAPAFRRRN
jgi:MFS family permease